MKIKYLFGKTYIIKKYRNGHTITIAKTLDDITCFLDSLADDRYNRPVKGEK